VTLVPFVVNFLFFFGCGFAALSQLRLIANIPCNNPKEQLHRHLPLAGAKLTACGIAWDDSRIELTIRSRSVQRRSAEIV